MIEEHRRVYRVSLAIVLVLVALSFPSDRRVSYGLLLGISLYYAYLLVLTKTVTAQIEASATGHVTTATGFLLRILVLSLPLLVAVRFQQHFSVLAAFAPILVNHLVTFALYARREVAA